DIGPRTLTRLYTVHVLLVPLTMFLLVGVHLYLVVQQGTITKAERQLPVESPEEQRKLYKDEAHSPGGETFFPHTMFKTGIMAGVVVAVTLLLTLTRGPGELMPE